MAVTARARVIALVTLACVTTLAFGSARLARPASAIVHGAYCYDYMPPDHLDSLRAAGFDRALIHMIPDSLTPAAAAGLAQRVARGQAAGVEVVPEWLVQNRARLLTRPLARRYTWGAHAVAESTVACPLDSMYWRSAVLDRAEEMLAAAPNAHRLAIDLEVMQSHRTHYDAGPCRCAFCRTEYARGDSTLRGTDPSRWSGFLPWQEARVQRILRGVLAEFAARHPGVELGVLDLDYDSFVHRGVARALAAAGVPTVDYTERSYGTGVIALAAARGRLDALKLTGTPLVGGLWLKRFGPQELTDAIQSIDHRYDGVFVFTTYSLWQAPSKLTGPYTLQAPARDYWRALARAMRTP